MGWGLDDLIGDAEDLWDDTKEVVGKVVDVGSDAVADVADALGADGVADNIREWGDHIADELGATPDEKNLNESDVPKDLIHGEPGVMRDRAGKLEGLSTNFSTAADGLAGINVGEFQGEAADAYHQKISQEIPKWRDAASACKSAAAALNTFAPIVEAAQQRAAEAIEKWKEGLRQHEQWVQACNEYNAAVDSDADTLPPKPPDEDPGKKLCEEAVQILNDARKARNEGASSAASAFNNAANEAPPEPPPSQRVAADFKDFADTAAMFNSHSVVGLVGAVTDLGKLVRTVDPTNPYNIAHPAEYVRNTTAVGAGLTNMAAHPDQLIKGFIGDGWGKDPGQAFGTFASNFIPFGPKGTGAIKTVLKDAAEGGARDVGRTAAGAATHSRPAEGLASHSTPHSPPEASVSPHTGGHDATPAATTHEAPAAPAQHPHADAPAETQPRVESPHEPAPEPPRAADPPSAERPPAEHSPSAPERHDPDQAALHDRGPDPEPRQETPPADRTPEPRTDSPAPHDRSPEPGGRHGDDPEPSPRDPEGRDPEPRQERVPDESPTPREHDGTPTERPHDSTPAERPTENPRPDGDRPAETPHTDKTEPASAPHDSTTPRPETPAVRDESPTPARTDPAPSSTPSTAPHSNSPAPQTPVNPARAETPSPMRDAPTQAAREVPTAREAPVSRPPEAPAAKPSPAAAADNAPKPAAAAAKDAVNPTEAARPGEAVAVMDRGPAHPGGGDRTMPTKSGGHGGDGPGIGHKPDDHHPDGPEDGGYHDKQDTPETAKNDPAASNQPHDTKTCNDPVDMATGAYVLPAVDVDLPAVLGLRLSRTHKSNYRAGIWLGPSWSCTFDSRVIVTADSVTTVDADGTMLSFDPPVADEPSVARIGRPWQLWNAPNGGYRLQPPHAGLSYHFAPKPHLGGADAADGVIFISAITDAHNNRILFTYNDSGAPSGVVHSGGYRIGVDCAGSRIRGYTLATDTESTVLRRFGYTRGDLTAVTDAAGATTSFEYDDQHRMLAWTDSSGAHYANTFDEQGRVVRQVGDRGVWSGTFTYTDDAGGRTSTFTDAVGNTTVYGFDTDLRPRAVADPLGRVTRTDFNADRDPLAISDPTGATTTLRYTPDGLPAQITDPLGGVTTINYVTTAAGPRPAQVTAPDGAVTVFGYDDSGNRVQMRDAAGGVWRWVYDGSGAVAERIDPMDRRTRYATNPAGLPVTITDAAGFETHCSYDDFGQLIEILGLDGARTHLSYDRAGRVTSRTAPDGSSESWSYDGEGNRISYTNAVGATTRWEYGFYDLPVARIDADGSRTHFSYDNARRLIAVTNAAGLTWSYQYAADGMLAAQTDFDGATTRYTYDAAGRLASRTNAVGQTVTYSYDAAGRMISESSGDGDFGGERVDYTYDAAGKLLSVVMPWAHIEYGYDAAGRVISETTDDRVVQSVFNAAGDAVETFTPSGLRTALSYDRRGLVESLSTAGQRCEITSDELGRTTRLQYGTTAIDSAFDTAGRLTGRRVLAGLRDLSVLNLGTGSGGATQVLAAASYTFRPDDTLAEVSTADPTAPVLGTAASYGTDILGRLVSRRPADAVAESTVFDAAQNPTITEGSAATAGWRYEGTRLIDDGRARYHYDAAGRLIQTVTKRLSRKPDVWHYHWDAWDRLRTVVTPDGQTYRYTYDPSGRRLTKISDQETVTFAWHGTQLVEQTTTTGQVTSWSYLPGQFTPRTQTHTTATTSDLRAGELSLDTPAALAPQTEIDRRFYALVTDHIDTPVGLLDPTTGTLAGQAHASMWGQTTWTGTDTPWRYPGQYHDPETGLHYNHHRYYQPHSGRYLSPDPLGLAPAPNPYGYVGNPTAFVDPYGLNPCEPNAQDRGNRSGERYGNGNAYTVAYDTTIEPDLFPGHTRGEHFRAANQALLDAIDADPRFAEAMENLIPGIRDSIQGPTGAARPRSPAELGWTWHHHVDPGRMQLVPEIHHPVGAGGKPNTWRLMHPGGRGGMAIWG
ncbi:putative T7SS-secreted protein [Mycobacterium sp. BMJ-28]